MQTTDVTAWKRLSRSELTAAICSVLPAAADPEPDLAALDQAPRGGRDAALAALAAIDPASYARTRNHVAGAVTGLSPWIRHGVLSTAEVRDAALTRVERPEDAEKLVSELAWREYWRQVQATLGDRIAADIEPPAATPRASRLPGMPDEVLAAATGMRCIDDFVRRLHGTGRLHNHERMWLASWLVHVRGVPWRVGADWFLRHLLDGDPASNHLSWQWVAGTFSAKPYLFNRENLERYTSGALCAPCPLLGRCDVEGSYEDLTARLFAPGPPPARGPLRITATPPWRPATASPPASPLVWLTLDAAAATSPAVVAHRDRPALFVIDTNWLATERPTLKRLVFLLECLADVPDAMIELGDPAAVVPARARALGCDGVALAETSCPRTRSTAEVIARDVPVSVHGWPRFCDLPRGGDIGRFSRFWSRVRTSALRPTLHHAG